MTARFSLEIKHPVPPVDALDMWVLVPGPVVGATPTAVRARRDLVTAQGIVWLRDRLMFAYLAPSNYTETGREPDAAGTGVVEQQRLRDAFPRRRAQELAACPVEGSAEVGKLPLDYVASLARDTTRVTYSETRAKKKSSIPLPPTAFQDAHLVRTVTTLAPEYSRWIRYAYGDSKEWDDEAGCVLVLWERVAPKLGKLQAKTLKRAQGLAHMAVQDHKLLKNCGIERHCGVAVALLLGVSEVNYRQHWVGRWQAMHDELDKLDTEALEALWKAL